MAYKNKNKQKAHMQSLKQVGWRKENRIANEKAQLRKRLRCYISDKDEVEKIIQRQFKNL